MSEYEVYTDGAYSSNVNRGGIGVAVYRNSKLVATYNRGFSKTTNNRMELSAIIVALSMFKKPVDHITIYSDSMYCIGTIKMNWATTSNEDLWKLFYKVYDKVPCSNIDFTHVLGHSTCEGNNLVDELAVIAKYEKGAETIQ